MPAYERYTHTYTHYFGSSQFLSLGPGSSSTTQYGSTGEQSAGTTSSSIFYSITLPSSSSDAGTTTYTTAATTFTESLSQTATSSHITPTPTYTTTSPTAASVNAPNGSSFNYYDSKLTTETKTTSICSTRTVTTENTTDASTELYNADHTYEVSGIDYDYDLPLSNTYTSRSFINGEETLTLSNGFYDTPDGTTLASFIDDATRALTGQAYGYSTITSTSLSSDTDLQSRYGTVSFLQATSYFTGTIQTGVSILTSTTSTTGTSFDVDTSNTFSFTEITSRVTGTADGSTTWQHFASISLSTERNRTRTFYRTEDSLQTRYSSSTSTGTDIYRSNTDVDTSSLSPIHIGLNMTVITPVFPAGFVGFGFDDNAATRQVYKTTLTTTAGDSFSQIPTSGIMGELSTKSIGLGGGKLFVTGGCGLPANNSSRTLSWFTSPTTPEFSTVSKLLATHASTYTSAVDAITSTLTSTRGMSISMSCKSVMSDKDDFVIFDKLSTNTQKIFKTRQTALDYNDNLAAERTVAFSVGSYTISKTNTDGVTTVQVTNITDRWFTSVMSDGENWAVDKVDSQDTALAVSYYDWDIPWPPDFI